MRPGEKLTSLITGRITAASLEGVKAQLTKNVQNKIRVLKDPMSGSVLRSSSSSKF